MTAVDYLSHLADELAKPVNPTASDVEYLPTQFLTEVIRSEGYDGLVFNSAMGPGQNLVLFDPEAAHVSSVDLYTVTDIQYGIAPG